MFINLDLTDKNNIICNYNLLDDFKKEINYILYPIEKYPKSKYKIEITDYYANNFDFKKKCCNAYIKVSITETSSIKRTTKSSKKSSKTKTLLIDLGEYHDFIGLYEENTKHYIDHLYVQGDDILINFDTEMRTQITDVLKKKYSK